MRLVDMRTVLRSRIGNPTEVDVPGSVLNQELNAAYLDIIDRYRFHKARKRCQFFTVVGQSRYDLPNDILAVLRVSDETNFRKLVKRGDRQLKSLDNYTTQGKPENYVRYRDWIELYPIPDGVYLMEVFYKFAHGALVQDEDQPSLPLVWHEGILMLAKHKYYINIANDQPKAVLAYEAWKLWVSDKPTEIDEETVDIDSGVEIVPLSTPTTERLDFNHAD